MIDDCNIKKPNAPICTKCKTQRQRKFLLQKLPFKEATDLFTIIGMLTVLKNSDPNI